MPVDTAFPIDTRAMPNSIIVKSMLGLICQGKSDFEAIEGVRASSFFKDALGIESVPSCSRLRQRMDTLACEENILAILDAVNLRMLQQAQLPITPLATGHVALDIDVFTMDNSA